MLRDGRHLLGCGCIGHDHKLLGAEGQPEYASIPLGQPAHIRFLVMFTVQ